MKLRKIDDGLLCDGWQWFKLGDGPGERVRKLDISWRGEDEACRYCGVKFNEHTHGGIILEGDFPSQSAVCPGNWIIYDADSYKGDGMSWIGATHHYTSEEMTKQYVVLVNTPLSPHLPMPAQVLLQHLVTSLEGTLPTPALQIFSQLVSTIPEDKE